MSINTTNQATARTMVIVFVTLSLMAISAMYAAVASAG